MPRIITSETTVADVVALRRLARKNKRSMGQEALLAVQTHVYLENECEKMGVRRKEKK